jgi:hypothetical protein
LKVDVAKFPTRSTLNFTPKENVSSVEYGLVYVGSDWSGNTTGGKEVCDWIGIGCSGEVMGILECFCRDQEMVFFRG